MDLDPSTLKLWEHQRAAIDSCERYFESKSSRSCLVHMPTGTGKTRVMVVLASRRSADSAVLVVCPSNVVLAWQVEWHYIVPGKPMQNGLVEIFISCRWPVEVWEA